MHSPFFDQVGLFPDVRPWDDLEAPGGPRKGCSGAAAVDLAAEVRFCTGFLAARNGFLAVRGFAGCKDLCTAAASVSSLLCKRASLASSGKEASLPEKTDDEAVDNSAPGGLQSGADLRWDKVTGFGVKGRAASRLSRCVTSIKESS